MPSDAPPRTGGLFRSRSVQLAAGALAWLALISALHLHLNGGRAGGQVVRMGYMPVITNLAAPLLDHASRDRTDLRFQAVKFASFAEMAEALRNGQIQAAFMIAPLSVVLHQQGVDVRVVLIGNRHESTLVVRKDLPAQSLRDLAGRTVAVPMRFSGHNLCLLRELEGNALTGQVRIVEMNPPDMASALATGSLDAYFVGEPFAAQTLMRGDSRRLHYVEELWEGFICNLVVVRQELIDRDPRAVRLLVQGAVRAGLWASANLPDAARIAAGYWNQPLDVVTYALNTPPRRVVFDRYTPKPSEMQAIADLMQRHGLIPDNAIDGLVDSRFAAEADTARITGVQSILPP